MDSIRPNRRTSRQRVVLNALVIQPVCNWLQELRIRVAIQHQNSHFDCGARIMRVVALLLALAVVIGFLIRFAPKNRLWVAWLLALAFIVALPWFVWKSQPWIPAGQAMYFRIGALLLALAAVIAVLLRLAWKIRPWVAWLLVVGIICAVAYGVWEFHPWMPVGKAVFIGSWKFGDCDFEVWQQKNAEWGEPFATGLFARKQSERWRAFLLDFEDLYHPSIMLQKEGSEVVIVHDGDRLGIFDEGLQTFKREPNGTPDKGTVIAGEPPGDWWQK